MLITDKNAQPQRACSARPNAAPEPVDPHAPGPKLLTGNVNFPGGRTVLELLRSDISRERLQLQRISLTLLCVSLTIISLALSLYFAEQSPSIAALFSSQQVAQTLLLATLALCVIAYMRRTFLKAFAGVMCVAVTSLYLHETLLLHSLAERLGISLHHDGVRLSCVITIAAIGYFARCYWRNCSQTRVAIFTIPSTRLFLAHMLPLFTLTILIANSLLAALQPDLHSPLVEQIFLRYAYAALFIAMLIDAFAINHASVRYHPRGQL